MGLDRWAAATANGSTLPVATICDAVTGLVQVSDTSSPPGTGEHERSLLVGLQSPPLAE